MTSSNGYESQILGHEDWFDTHLPHDRGPYFNDPQMSDVLAWHRSLCEECIALDSERENCPPPALGTRGFNCDEWYEIIAEYAEYEGQYAFLGNP